MEVKRQRIRVSDELKERIKNLGNPVGDPRAKALEAYHLMLDIEEYYNKKLYEAYFDNPEITLATALGKKFIKILTEE